MRVSFEVRRRAVFYVIAPSRSRRAARGLISRAIRSMLGTGYTRAPYFCEYESAAKQAARGEGVSPRHCLARYSAQLTDVECEAILLAVSITAEREGWSSSPLQCSHH